MVVRPPGVGGIGRRASGVRVTLARCLVFAPDGGPEHDAEAGRGRPAAAISGPAPSAGCWQRGALRRAGESARLPMRPSRPLPGVLAPGLGGRETPLLAFKLPFCPCGGSTAPPLVLVAGRAGPAPRLQPSPARGHYSVGLQLGAAAPAPPSESPMAFLT